jgi:hypothetical protein
MNTNTNPRSEHIHTTATTIAQSETEDEVAPFFIDLSTLKEDTLDHLRSVGLLPPLLPRFDGRVEVLNEDHDDNANDATAQCQSSHVEEEFDPLAIRLLRSAHTAYLAGALSDPLSKGFVSLDASHPWMVYWCLHSLDLLGYFDDNDDDHRSSGGPLDGVLSDALMDVEVVQKGQLLKRIVSTLDACWTDVAVDILRGEVMSDARLKVLYPGQQHLAHKVPAFT